MGGAEPPAYGSLLTVLLYSLFLMIIFLIIFFVGLRFHLSLADGWLIEKGRGRRETGSLLMDNGC